MGFALVWLLQGPYACWQWFLSAPLPRSLHYLLTSPSLAARIPAWLVARFTVQLREAGTAVSIRLILPLFSPFQLPASSLMPCTEWSSLGLCLPKPAHLRHHREPSSPPHVLSPRREMNRPPISPVSPVLQQQLLRCFLPVSQAGSPDSKSSSILETQTIYKEQRLCNKDCGTGKESSICLYFGALRLSIPTGPSSSLKPFPHPLCSLFMFTCCPINSPFSCAPAVALSSDHCTGAINPLDCIRL